MAIPAGQFVQRPRTMGEWIELARRTENSLNSYLSKSIHCLRASRELSKEILKTENSNRGKYLANEVDELMRRTETYLHLETPLVYINEKLSQYKITPAAFGEEERELFGKINIHVAIIKNSYLSGISFGAYKYKEAYLKILEEIEQILKDEQKIIALNNKIKYYMNILKTKNPRTF